MAMFLLQFSYPYDSIYTVALIALDLFVKITVLISMPETLRAHFSGEQEPSYR
ncbi:hypothetical protein ACFLX9_00275 [Chloroflexota bacterium]